MKQLLQILLLIVNCTLFINNGMGQNLVPNPSFEDMIACPTDNSLITHTANWQPFSSSPDYFNSCVPSIYTYSVPDNLHGSQLAASGQAYAGIISYVEGETDYSIDREILGNQFSTPLIIGQKYYVSFKVSLGTNTPNTGHSLGINKLGALFSTVPYTNTNSSTIPPIQNFAHVYTDSIITDSTNWTTIFGSFIADSAYTYISIGNFFKVENTDTIHVISNNPFTPNAYYYLDDVCVSTDSLFTLNYIYTGIDERNEKSSLAIYPNPASNYINLEFDDYKEHIITIYNSTGQLMLSKTIIHQDIMNTESLSQGIYYIQSRQGNAVLNKKLIIY